MSRTVNPLTKTEFSQYRLHDKVVQQNTALPCEVLSSLKVIRDGKLYRENHVTFAEYCEARTTFSHRDIDSEIKVLETKEELGRWFFEEELPKTEQHSDNQRAKVVAVHLETRDVVTRVRSAKMLLELHKDSKESIILAGDFNATPPGFPHSEQPPVHYGKMNTIQLLTNQGKISIFPDEKSARETLHLLLKNTRPCD